jgi:hypothetical protein
LIGRGEIFLALPGMTRQGLTMNEFNARVMPQPLKFSFLNDKRLLANAIYYGQMSRKGKETFHGKVELQSRGRHPDSCLIFGRELN